MKIKEIIPQNDYASYKTFLSMDLLDYAEWYVNRERSGINNNDKLKSLYERVLKNLDIIETEKKNDDNQVVSTEIDPILEDLNKIPISEIEFYSNGVGLNKTIIEKLPTLGALYIFKSELKQSKAWQIKALKLQEILKEQSETIIKEYYDFKQEKSLPNIINKEKGFAENFFEAIKEFIEYIEKRRGDRKYSSKWMKKNSLNTLKYYFLEGKSYAEIGKLLNRDPERSRQIIDDFLKEFMSGELLCSNLHIHDDLLEWIDNIKEQCLYHSKSFVEGITGMIRDEDDIKSLGLDLVDVEDNIQFVVPNRTKTLYGYLSSCILETLRKTLEPSTPTSIFEIVKVSDKYSKKIDSDFDMEFVYNILSCPEIVEIMDNGLVRIKEELLKTNQEKAARLMYDLCQERKTIKKEDLSKEYEKKYNIRFNDITLLREYGFNPVQNGSYDWHYGGSLEQTVLSAVKEYAEKNIIFYYDDIEKSLKDKGFVLPKSFRTYITIICYVDVNDSNHFCHKDYCDDHNDFNWRSQSQSGLSNWILNQAKDIIAHEDELSLKNVIDYIVEKSRNTNYNKNIRSRVTPILKSYSGDDKPFIIIDNKLRKNLAIYENTDFNTIGIRGEKYSFFKLIRAIITNEIKKCKDGKLLLVDAIEIVNDSIEEYQDRNTIIRAIENKHLPSIGLELRTIDGKKYIIKSQDQTEIHVEPIFEVRGSENNQDESVAVEELTVQDRPSITYRLTVDWEKLSQALSRELSFYTRYMESDNIKLSEAVAKFISFIKESTNNNLSSKLPQNLYEYCFASTDYFDRETYLSNLALFFEGLLYDIQHRRDKYSRKKGLGDLALEFPKLAYAISSPSQQVKGFERIFKDLYYKRNKLAHGESLDLNSSMTAKSILDFTALYIYTIALYT